jgi:transposase
MATDRTALAKTARAKPPVCGPRADPGPRRAHRDSLRAAQWHSLAHVAAGNGLRLRDHLLAATGPLAAGRRVETTACRPARRVTPAGTAGSGPCGGRQRVVARDARGKKTGPNPTDRRKAGSKHHVLTDADGIPLVATLTAANRPDITQLLDLVDAMPAIGGRPGPPCRKPHVLQGDRGYDSERHRAQLRARGIIPLIARRYRGHGSGLGRTRWVVERTFAWLHRFRRLAVRYERRPSIHEAFLTLGCALICWYYLRPGHQF